MKKIVLVLGITSMLVSCSNEKTEQVESQRQIDSINRALDHKLELIEYSRMNGSKYNDDSVKVYRAYQSDSLGLDSVDKINYINKK